jgi:hypothetical protein
VIGAPGGISKSLRKAETASAKLVNVYGCSALCVLMLEWFEVVARVSAAHPGGAMH